VAIGIAAPTVVGDGAGLRDTERTARPPSANQTRGSRTRPAEGAAYRADRRARDCSLHFSWWPGRAAVRQRWQSWPAWSGSPGLLAKTRLDSAHSGQLPDLERDQTQMMASGSIGRGSSVDLRGSELVPIPSGPVRRGLFELLEYSVTRYSYSMHGTSPHSRIRLQVRDHGDRRTDRLRHVLRPRLPAPGGSLHVRRGPDTAASRSRYWSRGHRILLGAACRLTVAVQLTSDHTDAGPGGRTCGADGFG
jgi:hypothetical protein